MKLIKLGCSILVFSHSPLKSDKMFYWDELIQMGMCFFGTRCNGHIWNTFIRLLEYLKQLGYNPFPSMFTA